MIRSLRELRLVPIVLFATVSLFALKTVGLLIDGHYALDETRTVDDDITGTIPGAAKVGAHGKQAQSSPQSWAQQIFNYPDITGAAGEKKPEAPPKGPISANTPEQPPAGTKGWKPVPLDGGRAQSPAEIAVLERLQERRAELETRAKEIEMRESLLKAAEKRLEGRVAELRDLEARVNNSLQQRDEAEAARFKNVVTMYENMKPKDAAKIFDRLDVKMLVEVAKEINPRRMSDILAQMSPDAAQQLTVELATRVVAKDNAAEEGFNRWTINGAAYPMTGERAPASFHLKEGRRYRIRMHNASDDIHPIHLHRHSFELTGLAGLPSAGILKDVMMLGGYQEAEVDFIADNPGLTLFHCHQQLHMDYGFMTLFAYA